MQYFVCTALAVIAMVSCGLQAATIAITDLTEGNPLVVSNLPNKIVLPDAEFVNITGSLNLAIGAIPSGTHSVLLTEPGFPGVYSDYVTLIASPVILRTQIINLTFGSDGSDGFNAAVTILSLLKSTTTILETGGVQDLTTALGSNSNLTITVQSDLDTPEPGSFVLLGTGLLAGLVLLRRRSAT